MIECPPEFYECLTEEEYDEILEIFEENEIVMPDPSRGGVQAYRPSSGSLNNSVSVDSNHASAYFCQRLF